MRRIMMHVLVAAAPLALAQEQRSDYRQRYEVLSERNMFLRDRPSPRAPTTHPAPTTRVAIEPRPEVPEERFVLRGVVIEDDALRAYFEDTRGGMARVGIGDALATGAIAEIGIDAVAFEKGGQVTWIEVGHNLAGARAPLASGGTTGATITDAAATGTATTGAATTAPPGDPATMTLEERMRLRRLQQQGR